MVKHSSPLREDEASSESNKKVEWYSDRHDNLTDDVRMAENKASGSGIVAERQTKS